MSRCFQLTAVNKVDQIFVLLKQTLSCEQRAGKEGKNAGVTILRYYNEFACRYINREAIPASTIHHR